MGTIRENLIIGMFPGIPLRKIRQVGNAAGVGSKMILASKKQKINSLFVLIKIILSSTCRYLNFKNLNKLLTVLLLYNIFVITG